MTDHAAPDTIVRRNPTRWALWGFVLGSFVSVGLVAAAVVPSATTPLVAAPIASAMFLGLVWARFGPAQDTKTTSIDALDADQMTEHHATSDMNASQSPTAQAGDTGLHGLASTQGTSTQGEDAMRAALHEAETEVLNRASQAGGDNLASPPAVGVLAAGAAVEQLVAEAPQVGDFSVAPEGHDVPEPAEAPSNEAQADGVLAYVNSVPNVMDPPAPSQIDSTTSHVVAPGTSPEPTGHDVFEPATALEDTMQPEPERHDTGASPVAPQPAALHTAAPHTQGEPTPIPTPARQGNIPAPVAPQRSALQTPAGPPLITAPSGGTAQFTNDGVRSDTPPAAVSEPVPQPTAAEPAPTAHDNTPAPAAPAPASASAPTSPLTPAAPELTALHTSPPPASQDAVAPSAAPQPLAAAEVFAGPVNAEISDDGGFPPFENSPLPNDADEERDAAAELEAQLNAALQTAMELTAKMH